MFPLGMCPDRTRSCDSRRYYSVINNAYTRVLVRVIAYTRVDKKSIRFRINDLKTCSCKNLRFETLEFIDETMKKISDKPTTDGSFSLFSTRN